MTMRTNQISARTRGLGIELKKLRQAANLTTRDAADKVGIMSPATLNRIELGTKAPSPEEVSALMVVYHVDGLERARIMDLARDAAMSGWWDSANHSESWMHRNALISFEETASHISNYQQGLVPGLLQIPDYTRAVMATFDVPVDEAERRVAIRVGRQLVLSRPQRPQYLAVVDEAVLRRPIGDPAVMAEQVSHLAQLARRQNVTIQVLPFALGGHQGLTGSFSVFEFPKSPTIVFMEHRKPSVFLDKHTDTAVFQETICALRTTALGPADSIEFLKSVATEYDQR
jgi:DNA-binding XRE family transcriptional regulator